MKSVIVASLMLSLNASAADYLELARTRNYKGGPDETDLKVQAVLYQAPNKKKKVQKLEEPSEGF